MIRRSAALLVALTCPIASARADTAQHWKYDNPFCGAVAAVVPLGDGTRYGVDVFADHGTTLAAHVTLVGDTDAYDANVPDTNLLGTKEDRKIQPLVVTVPSGTKIHYFFVDSYAIDGGASVTCPSYVFPVGAPMPDGDGGANVVPAQHLQAIGKLACGHVYRDPETGRDPSGIIGIYGSRPLTASYHVYIDSSGRAVREDLIKSSGVEGVDSAALGIIQHQQFVPAQFLCTPVVGEMDLTLDYNP
jgi:hypothetical protein